jgi:hypothetical protein
VSRIVGLAFAAALTLLALPHEAFAWGSTGHRMIGVAAARSLPVDVPAFLRQPGFAADLGELSREADRSKDAGKVHDHDRNPAHFVDVEDDGRILGGPALSALPPTRAEYEKALRAAGTDQWQAGYLPYAIVDATQQLAKDFAYWRVLSAAERNPRWRAHRAWYVQDRRRREALMLHTLGDLGHFVGDGSQPLHVSAHYNGWGDYPNPKGYTSEKVHGPFEEGFVSANVRLGMIAGRMRPLRIPTEPLETHVAAYLGATFREVEPFYALEKARGFQPGDPRGTSFAAERLAASASELRDLIALAWRMSATQKVGWKPVAVADVLAGRVDPYDALYGAE